MSEENERIVRAALLGQVREIQRQLGSTGDWEGQLTDRGTVIVLRNGSEVYRGPLRIVRCTSAR